MASQGTLFERLKRVLGFNKKNDKTQVRGDLDVTGVLSKGGGSFLIPHPDPTKEAWKLRHCFIETPSRGDNIYRYLVDTVNLSATIALPSYFKYLNENTQCLISAEDVLGYGKAKVDAFLENVNVTVNVDGRYSVLVIGTRKDELMCTYWDEYEAELPPDL